MIIPAILAVALLAAFGLLAASKKSGASPSGTPELPPGGSPETPGASLPGGDPAGAAASAGPGTGSGVIPPGALPPSATPPVNPAAFPGGFDSKSPGLPQFTKLPIGVAAPVGTGSGATSVAKDGSVDDAFDVLVATALAKGDIPALTALAAQATARGLLDVARSIRDEISRLQATAPLPTPPGPTVPKIAAPTSPIGMAVLSKAAGSKGADVMVWQGVVGVTQDGIFGQKTHDATVAFQKANGLVPDGIVGPKTWAAAFAAKPTLASTPRPAVVVTNPFSRPTIQQGSTGAAVVEWQGILGVKADGIFGPQTRTATISFQQARGLKADGIVGPQTWTAGFAAKPSIAVKPAATVPQPIVLDEVVITASPAASAPLLPAAGESDARLAAIELTNHLKSIGGLAGRNTAAENKPKVAGLLSRLGKPDPTGKYGRQGAGAVMMQGLVPVVPFYWPSTGTSAAKVEFTNLVKSFAAADPQRSAEWNTLISDIQRA